MAEALPERKPDFFLALAAVIFGAAFGHAILQGFTNPVLNWDMLPYIGSVISLQMPVPAIIHDQMLTAVKPAVPEWLYTEFSEKNTLSADIHAFYAVLPFYRTKPLYIGAVWLMHRLGIGLAEATWLVSALSFTVLTILLAQWQPQQGSRAVWAIAISGLCALGAYPLGMLAGYSTPDALGLVFFMGGIMGWLQNRSTRVYALCMFLSFLARPDGALLILMLTAFFSVGMTPERQLKPAAALALITAICVAWYATGIVSWDKLFYHTFVNLHFDLTGKDVTVTWSQYRNALVWGLAHEAKNVRLEILIAFSAMAWWYGRHGNPIQREWLWLLAVVWASFAIRFLIFPAWGDERYYYPVYVLAIMACVELISPAFKRRA